MGIRSRVWMGAALALLAVLLAAPYALAAARTKAAVRVEASAYTLAPPTAVAVDPVAVFYDTAGNPYRPGYASALGALSAAAKARGFSWEAGYGGNFVMQIGGFSALPDWSQGWVYAVNGTGFPFVSVGALDFRLASGDKVLFAQSPDATMTRGMKLLAARVDQADRAYETGQSVVVTVVGDDLAKVNSTTEAARYEAGPADIETAAQFQPVAGATVHLGSLTATTDALGQATFADATSGTYSVWAEAAMDASFVYVRSTHTLVNMAQPLTLENLSATPQPFTPGQTVRFHFTLSRAATAKYTVRTKGGSLVASLTRRLGAGDVTMRWSGENAAGRPVRAGEYRVRVTASDAWGRTPTALSATIKGR